MHKLRIKHISRKQFLVGILVATVLAYAFFTTLGADGRQVDANSASKAAMAEVLSGQNSYLGKTEEYCAPTTNFIVETIFRLRHCEVTEVAYFSLVQSVNEVKKLVSDNLEKTGWFVMHGGLTGDMGFTINNGLPGRGFSYIDALRVDGRDSTPNSIRQTFGAIVFDRVELKNFGGLSEQEKDMLIQNMPMEHNTIIEYHISSEYDG